MNIGQSIKQLRKDLNTRQWELAKNAEISQTYLSQIENGVKKPSTDVLEKIAFELDIPLPILYWYGLEREDIKPSKHKAYMFLKPSIDAMIKQFFTIDKTAPYNVEGKLLTNKNK